MILNLSTDLILIYWKQRSWKTMFATLLSLDRINRLYWNINISFKWIELVKKITEYTQFETFFKIGSSENNSPGYVIVDEIGMNFNSKDAMSKRNKVFSNFIFLQWKYNLSTIWIAQRWSSIPIDLKDLASIIFEVEKINRSWKTPLFKITEQVYNPINLSLEFKNEYIIDLIAILKHYKLEYDTLDTSIIN